MKKDLLDKSSRIDTQNNKISELLQQNQMYVVVVLQYVYDILSTSNGLRYIVM